MSSDIAIRINDIKKCFFVYKRPLDRVWQLILGRRGKLFKEVWALKGISFDVMRGEAIGIIGRNGSGKSTLLEILSDTITETSGEVIVNGRVAALLELGAGFNPEFTGRENIYTNAAIMGIPDRVITERFDEIVEFSEIREYIDQPVKTYSSGMYIRLAFAVAINMDPDILIVDEALSVGDIRFQRKCFRKFEELKKSGKTIIFVTHATDLVVNHCDRAVFIDSGNVMQIGTSREVVNAYLDFMFGHTATAGEKTGSQKSRLPYKMIPLAGFMSGLNQDPNIDGCSQRRNYNPTEHRWGDQSAMILDYLVKADSSIDPMLCRNGEQIDIYVIVYFRKKVLAPIYGLTVKTVDGVEVYGANTRKKKMGVQGKQANEYSVLHFRFDCKLLAGDYFISLGVASDDEVHDHLPLDRRYDLIHLRIEDDGESFGIADLGMQIKEISVEEDNVVTL